MLFSKRQYEINQKHEDNMTDKNRPYFIISKNFHGEKDYSS